jgi:hypothetical protein
VMVRLRANSVMRLPLVNLGTTTLEADGQH